MDLFNAIKDGTDAVPNLFWVSIAFAFTTWIALRQWRVDRESE